MAGGALGLPVGSSACSAARTAPPSPRPRPRGLAHRGSRRALPPPEGPSALGRALPMGIVIEGLTVSVAKVSIADIVTALSALPLMAAAGSRCWSCGRSCALAAPLSIAFANTDAAAKALAPAALAASAARAERGRDPTAPLVGVTDDRPRLGALAAELRVSPGLLRELLAKLRPSGVRPRFPLACAALAAADASSSASAAASAASAAAFKALVSVASSLPLRPRYDAAMRI